MLKYRLDTIPRADQYLQALRELETEGKLKEMYRKILILQYLRPNHTITANTLNHELGISVITINGYYGRLGHWLSDKLNIVPSKREGGGYRWWCVLSSGETQGNYFQWEMYTEFAQAIEQLGILETTVI